MEIQIKNTKKGLKQMSICFFNRNKDTISIKGMTIWLYHLWRNVPHVQLSSARIYRFDTGISDKAAKMRAAALLGVIVCLHQRTQNPLEYVHKKSKYGHRFAILDSDTQELFKHLQDTKPGLTKFLFIRYAERRKIRWQWHNTCQIVCLRNMKMKQLFPLLNLGCLSALP